MRLFFPNIHYSVQNGEEEEESFARRKEAEHRETNSANFPLVDDAIMQNTLRGKM